MVKEYNYWVYEGKTCEKTGKVMEYIMSLRVNDDYDKKCKEKQEILNKAKEDMTNIEEKRNEVSKKLDEGNGKDALLNEEWTRLHTNYYVATEKYKKAKKDFLKLEEQNEVCKRNENVKIKVERLKDIYSRTEALSVVRMVDNVEDGKIASTISKISEDIYKLENYGLYLPPAYFEELAKVIKNVYLDLSLKEREFIDNDVPETSVIYFVQMCKNEILESNEEYLDEEGEYYNIPVKVLKSWYENSGFRRFSLTDLKEALIIHGYARGNKGRNDYTVAKIGKVISLKKSRLDQIEEDS